MSADQKYENKMSRPTPCEATRISEVQSELSFLKETITMLEYTIPSLEERLSIVLRNPDPPKLSNCKDEVPNKVTLALDIDYLNTRVGLVNEALNSLISRIEL